jgi:hypothetical protein
LVVLPVAVEFPVVAVVGAEVVAADEETDEVMAEDDALVAEEDTTELVVTVIPLIKNWML